MSSGFTGLGFVRGIMPLCDVMPDCWLDKVR